MSVNLAAAHLQRSAFRDALAEALARHPATPPGRLELEVLESAAIDDLDHSADVLAASREPGVRFALDDFGSDYSSLPYVVAEQGSRRWVDALVALVRAEPGAQPPLLDAGKCAFGRWHAGRGCHVYGGMEGFQDIGQAHQDLHRVGAELVALVRAGRSLTCRVRWLSPGW